MLKTSSGYKALMRSMSTSLILHEKAQTTIQKARLVRPFVEKIITCAKKKNLASIRKVAADIHDKQALKKLHEVLVPRYENRNGGYTRILKVGLRQGDAASIVVIKLLQ
ncbi:MAG: 50S ribosomal protein L17 [Elusimicrobia bacterium RIFOXYB2_FULL_48_7]|nr:MAG: 50S ribosomal protein L17 [Elusimicrobia bacterium RIFOXYB2_FULL_48_7]